MLRTTLRLSLVVWGISVIAITAVVMFSRLQSPDGVSSWLLYTSQSSGGVTSMYRVRPVASAPQQLDTPFVEVLFPCWSPDGEWIAFAASGKVEDGRLLPEYSRYRLYRMRAGGSQLEELVPAADLPVVPMNLRWSSDGQFLLWDMFIGESISIPEEGVFFSRTMISTVFRVQIRGVEVEYWQSNSEGDEGEWRPMDELSQIALSTPIQVNFSSAGLGYAQREFVGAWTVVYRPDAELPGLYRVPTQPNDSASNENDGELLLELSGQLTGMTVSTDGHLAFMALMGAGGGKVYRVDVSHGTVIQVVQDGARYHTMDVALSPDGRWVAVTANRSDASSVRLLVSDSERLQSLEALPLLASGIDPYRNLAWSPPQSQKVRWWILLAVGTLSLVLALGFRMRIVLNNYVYR